MSFLTEPDSLNYILSITLDLFNQIGILILSVFLFSGIKKKNQGKNPLFETVMVGLFFGGVAFVSMLYPVVLRPGVFVDSRLVIICVAILWGGPLSGMITAGIALIVRLVMGGMGTLAGTIGIFASILVGIIAYTLKNKLKTTDMQGIIKISLIQGGLLSLTSTITLLIMPLDNIIMRFIRMLIPILVYNIFCISLLNILLYREVSVRFLRRKMRVREKHFQALFHQAGDGLFLLDRGFGIIDVNEIALQGSGYSKDEVLQLSMKKMESHFPFISINEELEKAVGSDISFIIETDMTNKKGHVIPVEIRFTKIVVDDDVFLMVLVRNITLRRKHEAKIKSLNDKLTGIVKRQKGEIARNEAQFRSAFEYAGHGIVLAEPDGRFIKVNKAFLDITGYSEVEALTFGFQDLFDSETIKDEEKLLSELIQGEIKDFELEKSIIHKRGETLWIHLSVTLFRDENGEPVQFIGHILDITKQKEYQSALMMSEQRYRLLFKTMAQGVVFQDKSGKILSANPAAERILGLSLDELRGRTSVDPRWRCIKEDCSPFPGAEHPAMLALKSGIAVSDVIMGVFSPRDESFHWIVVNSVPQFRDFENEPYQVYSTFTDITQRKSMEDRLEQIAHYDHVTTVPNRYLFYKRIQDAYSQYHKFAIGFTLLYLDLDGFKLINDNYGHNAGDVVLRTIAERISGIIRHTDTVARLGGDEFVVILSDLVRREDIKTVTEKITESIRDTINYDGESLTVGTSIGIACFPHDTEDCNQVIKFADSAMYYAKNTGKNKYIFYDDIK